MKNRLKQAFDVMRDRNEEGSLVASARAMGEGDVLWAEVLSVERQPEDQTLVKLEVHDDEKIYRIGLYTRIPRGESLAVGDKVALAPENQTTRSDRKGAVSEGIADEIVDEAAFDLLPWWLPIGSRSRKEKFYDNGELPDWKIRWSAEPQFGRVESEQG